LVVTPQLPGRRKTGIGNVSCWALFLSLLVPTVTAADIYKWVDERGSTVISNIRPANPQKLSNFELLERETKPAATRTEQALLDRIDSLERRLQSQSYPPQVAGAPPSNYCAGYYPMEPPAPPAPPAYSGYPPGYYPGYAYDSWAPSFPYAYPGGIVFVNRPNFRFSHHRGAFHAPRMHHVRR
jgi:Domain of unknown function (DUF4124)